MYHHPIRSTCKCLEEWGHYLLRTSNPLGALFIFTNRHYTLFILCCHARTCTHHITGASPLLYYYTFIDFHGFYAAEKFESDHSSPPVCSRVMFSWPQRWPKSQDYNGPDIMTFYIRTVLWTYSIDCFDLDFLCWLLLYMLWNIMWYIYVWITQDSYSNCKLIPIFNQYFMSPFWYASFKTLHN